MDKNKQLNLIAEDISNCQHCDLGLTRKKTVPGEGDPNAKVLILGQAPGRQEDETGKPFIGRAGQLLTELLDAADLKREKVFITSVAKCFPPDNKKPTKRQWSACINEHLYKQIATIKPELIVLLGEVAITAMTKKKGVTKLHGKIIKYEDINFLCTFHPAACIRGVVKKDILVGDFKKIRTFLNKKL